MSTPLELAQRVVNSRRPIQLVGRTDLDQYWSDAVKLAAALIEAEKQREPVEIQPYPDYPLIAICPKCAETCTLDQKFCGQCGVPLKWTKEKA